MTATSTATAAIVLKQLRFRWPGSATDCLDINHFVQQRGERIFLHGPSGSGKTTLLSLIGGVLLPTSGRIEVLGTCTAARSAAARDRFRADEIGFIFQLFNLIPYLSAADNIRLACRFSAARRSRIAAQGRELSSEVQRLAARLDLAADLLARPAADLSVGQQQRVAAARALIGRPSLIIADEPTSALDADRQQDFLQLLLGECACVQASLLFVSHDLRLAKHFDRIVSLQEINLSVSV